MKLSENFSNSFSYSKKLLDDGGRIILLIILNLIPIVNWLVVGYGVRVLREAPKSESPPEFENYRLLFIDGAKIFFITLIYMAIPIILIIFGAASLFAEFFSSGKFEPNATIRGIGASIILLGIALGLLLMTLLGVGTAHMAKTGKFGKAFAFGEIINILNRIGKAKYLAWMILMSLVGLLIGGLTGSIPYVGWFLSAIISPFITVFSFRSLGDLYNDGAPPELQVTALSATGEVTGKCASCGTPLQPHHKFCPLCGVPVTNAIDTKLCVVCGMRIPSATDICGACGAKQN